MSRLKTLLSQTLSAAADDICNNVIERKMVLTSETSPEQQREFVHQRLLVVADEIFRILELVSSEYEADVCVSNEDVKLQRQLLNIMKKETNSHETDKLPPGRTHKTLGPLEFKDAATETDSEFIHQTQKAEKRNSAVMCDFSGSEDDDSDNKLNNKQLRSNKRKTLDADCCKMSVRSFHNDCEGKMKRFTRKNAAGDKRDVTRQSCCRVCGKFFRYKRSFLKHVLKHEESTDVCGVCGKHLESDKSLEWHLETHKEENSCRDQTDDKQLNSESSEGDSDEEWRESEGSDSDNANSDKDGSFRQKMEPKTKTHPSNKPKPPKNKHVNDLSNLKYNCRVCSRSFCYRASFLKHVQEDERDADVCGVCGKHFENEESLRLHLQTYVRTNDCEVCGKHFDGHKQLEMHMRTHTGEKPYICSVCGKAFAQNGNLMGHMRVHTGERPYACSVCGQSFSFKEYMMAHMRIHTGEKPFLCSVCGKGFRQRSTLKTHMMIHTGESKHRCSFCGKKFYKSGALKIHMRSHTGEKPYLCNVCGKSFTVSSSLTKHMAVHEGERTHRCGVCGKDFLRKEDMKRHVQTHADESAQLMSL